MFKKKKQDIMLVEEYQYRAVITYLPQKQVYRASVQRRIGINEWVKVTCGLKGVNFASKEQAEGTAKHKIRVQKSLDDQVNSPISYIIYDD
jgi:hypothetical protein